MAQLWSLIGKKITSSDPTPHNRRPVELQARYTGPYLGPYLISFDRCKRTWEVSSSLMLRSLPVTLVAHVVRDAEFNRKKDQVDKFSTGLSKVNRVERQR